MDIAWVEGRPADERQALDAAARLLGESRLALFSGAAADVAGLAALVRLARLAGGVLDHEGFDAVAPLLATFCEAGIMLGAPAEMRRRADRFLLVGPDPFAAAPELRDLLFAKAGPDLGRAEGRTREILHLGGEGAFALAPADVGAALAQIRAAVNGRPCRAAPLDGPRLASAAAFLREALFGCVVFAPATLDALDVELLCGLVEDLNRETRFACLPVTGGGGYAAAQVSAWMTGFPPRAIFGRGYPEFDPVTNAGARRVADGEADVALLLHPRDEPDWSGRLPVVAVGGDTAGWANPPRVALAVRPSGTERVVLDPRFAGLIAEDGGDTAPDLLDAIAARLGGLAS